MSSGAVYMPLGAISLRTRGERRNCHSRRQGPGGGEASEGRHSGTLLDIGPDLQPRAIICDKGCASKANRDTARKRGIASVITHKATEKNKPAFFAHTFYKARARIEQGIGRLKRFKRVALRCEKTATNYRSIVAFAAGLCLIEFVHTKWRVNLGGTLYCLIQ